MPAARSARRTESEEIRHLIAVSGAKVVAGGYLLLVAWLPA